MQGNLRLQDVHCSLADDDLLPWQFNQNPYNKNACKKGSNMATDVLAYVCTLAPSRLAWLA
jgi:hypothetical protein